MNTNLLDFTLTDKISCGACENNDNVYFTTCKTIFCSFNDHVCKIVLIFVIIVVLILRIQMYY